MKSLVIFLVIILSFSTIIADNTVTVDLVEGRNLVSVSEYFPSFYVSTLMKNYPEIDSVNLDDYSGSYGYVNAFGGIGTNFLIQYGTEYEVYVSSDITVSFDAYPSS